MSMQHHPRKPRPASPGVSREPRAKTIPYTCSRCELTLPSQPLPTDPAALRIYDLPVGWELTPAGDRSWCAACVRDIARGYPVDLRDLGRGRIP
jgi:hypothetical protein